VESEGWDERYAGSELVWSATPNQWVEQLTAELAPGRALDLAAGEGRNSLWLIERGWRATAVDFSQVGLDRARALATQRFGPDDQRLVTVCADLRDYQPDVQAFELVLVIYLQVDAVVRRAVMRAAAGAVAAGGRLLVVAHDSENLVAGVGGPQDPLVLYTAKDVAEDVAGCGLVVEQSGVVLRAVQTDDGERHAIDSIFMARRDPMRPASA
jgi:SAM-dependent methyltransferase